MSETTNKYIKSKNSFSELFVQKTTLNTVDNSRYTAMHVFKRHFGDHSLTEDETWMICEEISVWGPTAPEN